MIRVILRLILRSVFAHDEMSFSTFFYFIEIYQQGKTVKHYVFVFFRVGLCQACLVCIEFIV